VRNVWESLERFLTPRAQNPYTVCDSLAGEYNKRYRKDFAVIRNLPLPKERFIEEFEEEKVFIYRGAINMGRGLEQAILAMKNVDAGLLIAGDGDIYYELRKLVRNNRLSDKIAFTGYIVPEELDEFSLKARAGLNLLSNNSLSYYYSLANKFFDYMQLGLPQISMNFPEYKKINQEFEIATLINSLNVEEIGEAMNKLLLDNAYHSMLYENCLDARKVYHWRNEEKILLNHYEKFFIPANQETSTQ
jgi:glycosyltransferase involved in cell wall biosynthesis